MAGVVLLVLLLRLLPAGEWLAGTEAWFRDNPVAGALVYVAATVLAIVALVPGWLPMTLAGVLYGLLPGILLGTLAVTLGALAALWVGRTVARSWVEQRIAGNRTLLALDDALDEQAFTIVALTRVALVIPFNLLNYAYGLTRVRALTYGAATATGMLPIVALYAYVGTLARDIGEVLAGNTRPDADAWWIAGIAAVAIAIVIFVIRRAVRRALAKRTGIDQ